MVPVDCSEHMFDGIFYAAEMHFVHKDTVTGQQAVLAVLLKLDPTNTPNPDLNKFLPSTPNNYTATNQVRVSQANEILAANPADGL